LSDISCLDSERALETLISMYQEDLSRYIFMYVHSGEITEEIMSDVFYTVWENRKSITYIYPFKPYLYKIAKFRCLNYLRNNKKFPTGLEKMPMHTFASTQTTVEEEYISREMVLQLNSIIEELPPKCKLAFKLIREDKMHYKDAAEHLGVSIKTLESQVNTAIKKIK